MRTAGFARWTAEGGCPSVSFSAACEAGTANKPVIAAVNRCASKSKIEIVFFSKLFSR
jgi:hypothetical protein